ncbi:MAG: histidine phosphatase family protein [Gemmobacter sp.]
MTRFWWVRHGPTHQRAFTGWRDVPADLSDRARIARLDAHLPQGAVLVSSDLIRARATADVLTQGRERLPDLPGLREFDFGRWDGMMFDAVAAGYPDLSRAYWEAPGDIAPPGGESWNVAAARVGRAVAALIAAHPGRDIVAVAHLGVILTQVQAALGVPPAEAIGQPIGPLSVTRIEIDGPARRLTAVDHTP